MTDPIDNRRNKQLTWCSRGLNPYDNTGFTNLTQIGSVVSKHFQHTREDMEATPCSYNVAGRLITIRDGGKLIFAKLRDGTGEIQLFMSKKDMGDGFSIIPELDRGDHLRVTGNVMRTHKGELSIQVQSLHPLTKSLTPLPTEWFGVENLETRYRQRYVDLVANPEIRLVFQARTMIVGGLRDWLNHNQFMEVETPTLQAMRGGANAKPFETHHNSLDKNLYLRVAPELYLKRLIVGGFDRVYELGRVWRNEGMSTRHNPEFTILEFYQAYATYKELMDEATDLIRSVDSSMLSSFPGFKGGRTFSLEATWCRVRMLDAIGAALDKRTPNLGVEFRSCSPINWSTLRELTLGIPTVTDEQKNYFRRCKTDGELMYAFFEVFAEPYLVEDYRTEDGVHSVPVFVTDYPYDVSPLARRKDPDTQVAEYGVGFSVPLVDRFELFIDGRELANAFSELNDPDDQAERFQSQLSNRDGGDDEAMDFDQDYIEALRFGMPPTAGFGLGVDRLVMLLCGQKSIRDVLLFPTLR